ncbi:probable disease resistance protein At5g63020 isoform X2 [Prosopis cineraria]|uniref:probable disease resistance protein At5g63020 isoform X2 n=1 Tax=Prosopis cineraria TaxID=364024 RepID=UPI00240F8730|nr:probable disease resistance protein At5g63020 isoform X2 [Prosopis cineraria]
MAEILISIGAKVAEYLVDPIIHRARYLLCLNQFIGDVEKAREELEGKLEDVKRQKEEVDRETKEIMPSVQKWWDNVDAILEDVQKLQRKAEEGGAKKCFNVRHRYSLAKEMENKANRMKELKQNSNFEPFSTRIQLPSMPNFSTKDFVDFNSRKSTCNLILEAIKDGKNKIIGLYGIGGSGKTTLTKKLGDKVKELKLFDNCIIVVVSKPPNVLKIQQDIAEQIDFKLKEQLQFKRAETLSYRLRNKKIFIILDDVWSKLSLEEIGIPHNEDCCVLLTTRLRNVCVSMDCQSITELPLLIEEEAWSLFKMHANITNELNDEFDGIGREIVDECKGLPIAIVTVGSMLKGRRTFRVWKSTLGWLQHPASLDIEEDLRSLYAVLKISYDYLPSQLAKSIFLLCSMFPEDHEIHVEDLIRFGKGTLELDECIYTMEDARNEILATIEKLLDSCLLMPTNEQACVKLHDVVRDIALWIAKKEYQAILVDRNTVSSMLDKYQSLKDTKALSLWNLDENFKLPNQLHSPTLEILLLHHQGSIDHLGVVEALKVLVFITFSFKWTSRMPKTQLSILQSIVSLTNLHTLWLRGKVLGDISFLGELKKLEIFDLHGSQFDELPAGIVYMKKLKLLDVFGCEIEKSPLGVIGRCEQLEELYLWDKKSTIPKNFSLSRLKRYVIYDSRFDIHEVPFLEYFDGCDEALRALCIQDFKFNTLSSSMKDLILRANCLCLENCMWDHKDLNLKIKHLMVSCCREKRFIIDNSDVNNLQTKQVFSHLTTLRLREIINLEQVFQDSSIGCSLLMLQELFIERCPKLRTCIFTHAIVIPKLRKLEIYGCDKVKWLFPYSLTCQCPSLEELWIHSCSKLERFIGVDGDDKIKHEDQLLQHQGEFLYDMQGFPYGYEIERANNFKQLRNQKPLTFFLSLKFLQIRNCKRINDIFEVRVTREAQDPNLKLNSELCKLRLQDLPNLEYIWKGPTQIVSLHRLERVELWSCPRLKSIFSPTILTSLPEVRQLFVYECEEWEGVFCEESLKNLSSSSSSSNVCFPKLNEISIEGCNKVKRLLSYSLASHCHSLEYMIIHECSQLERLVDGDNDEESANGDWLPLLLKLKELTLVMLPTLRDIFTGELEYKLECHHDRHKKKNDSVRPKVLNSELCSIHLMDLPELEFIWKAPTQIISLHRLQEVKLWSCRRLKSIFTLAIITSLPKLKKLGVKACDQWEGVFCEESLQNLSSASSTVCFPSLERIGIYDCNKVKRLGDQI